MSLKNILSKSILFLLILNVLAGCDVIPNTPAQKVDERPIKMIVVNEGLFTTNTAALSLIYEDGESLFDIFRWVNNRPLGDVAQSLAVINGKYFVAINNSRKVEVVDPKTFESIATIRYDRAGSPRYITPLTDSTALVSDLYGQLVTIRTKAPYKVLEYIPLPVPADGVEQMYTTHNGKVFVAYVNQGVFVFDASPFRLSSMREVEGTYVTHETKSCKLLPDNKDNLWIIRADEEEGAFMEWQCISTETEEIIETVRINFEKDPKKITEGTIIGMPNYNRSDTSPDRKQFYFNLYTSQKNADGTYSRVQHVFTFDPVTKEYKPYIKVAEVGQMYGMNVAPNGDVFVCDCLDFTAQRGYIREYSHISKKLEHSYRVSVYPNFVYFPE